jgi:hypothetical protein
MSRFGHGQTPASSTNKKLKPGYHPNQSIRNEEDDQALSDDADREMGLPEGEDYGDK